MSQKSSHEHVRASGREEIEKHIHRKCREQANVANIARERKKKTRTERSQTDQRARRDGAPRLKAPIRERDRRGLLLPLFLVVLHLLLHQSPLLYRCPHGYHLILPTHR